LSIEDSLETMLNEWPNGMEIQISNPIITLGYSRSKIIFSGAFDDSGIRVVSSGASKDISEFKVEAYILCGTSDSLETIGSLEAYENEIVVKTILPAEEFYSSVQLLKEINLRSTLHLECVGLKREEELIVWASDKNQLSIKDASIMFSHKQNKC